MMTTQATCFIALGSNLENPRQQVLSAIAEFKQLEHIEVKKCSSLYQTKAVGPQPQPDFINAVIQIETSLSPQQLLQQLFLMEQQHGRERKERWGARTLDLDLLLFDDVILQTDALTIPHPRMLERDFVLMPLFEIAPELKNKLRCPTGG